MADSHPTPESKPMKSTATVTPTLHLSEGPLTPLGVGHRDIKTTRLWSGTSSIRKSEFEDIVSLRKETARISEVLDLKLSEHETCVQLQSKLEISEERLREQNQKLFTVQNEYQSYKDEMFKEIEDLKSKLLQEQLNYASLEKHCDDLNCEKTKIESYLQQLPSEEAYNRLKLELGEKNDKYISLEQKFKLSQEQTENLTLKCSAQAKEINQLKLKLEESDNQLKDASRRANYDRNSSSSAKDTSNPLEEDVFKLKKYVVLLKRRHEKEIESFQAEVSGLKEDLVRIQEQKSEFEGTNRLLRDQVEGSYGKMATMREQIASLQNILERQRRSDSKSTHKLRQETIKETTEACNELETLSVAWKQIQEGRDPDIACLLGIDPASPEWNRGREGGRRGQDEVHVITEEEFQQEMSNLVKKMKLALGDLRNFLSDKYADSMANQSGCITQ